MYLRSLLIMLVLGALVLFTVANWQAFNAPTTLSLIFASVEAPLGLVLLGMFIVLAALFLIYVVYLQSAVLFESRRHARELQAQRELAENAENSRIHELRGFLESQLETMGQQAEQATAELSGRLDQVAGDLRQSIEQCQNSLSASIAEIDDRLARVTEDSQPRKFAP